MRSRCLDRLEAKRIILRCSADLISACGRLTNAAKAWRNPLWRKLSGFFSSPSRFSPTCGGRKTSTAKQGVSLKGNGHDLQEIPQIKSIDLYRDQIISRSAYAKGDGWSDLEDLQQVTLGDRIEQFLAERIERYNLE